MNVQLILNQLYSTKDSINKIKQKAENYHISDRMLNNREMIYEATKAEKQLDIFIAELVEELKPKKKSKSKSDEGEDEDE